MSKRRFWTTLPETKIQSDSSSIRNVTTIYLNNKRITSLRQLFNVVFFKSNKHHWSSHFYHDFHYQLTFLKLRKCRKSFRKEKSSDRQENFAVFFHRAKKKMTHSRTINNAEIVRRIHSCHWDMNHHNKIL